MKTVINIVLAACVIGLIYVCYGSIMGPINFDDAKKAREKQVIARLIDIRKAQLEYRNLHNGQYTASFDTLIDFVKTAKLPFVKKEGVLSDTQLEAGMTEKKAMAIINKAKKTGNWKEVEKEGLMNFKRDTLWVAVTDTIYAPGFNADSLRYVPFGNGAQFEMAIRNDTTKSGAPLHLFQAQTPYETYLGGFTDAISHATVQISQEIKADTILTITESGFTARMIAKYKPQCTVVAVSRLPERVRAMQLYWGVLPLLGPYSTNTDEMIELSLQCALHHSVIKDGASVVITAGVPIGTPGSTNLIKVVTVGTKLLSGTGIGSKTVTGRICVGRTAADFKDKLQKGDILVVDVLNDEFVPQAAAKAAAIIAEEGGLTSSTAIVAVTCGLPVIVGAEKATSKLDDGLLVTVDPVSGDVYEGDINL